MDLLSVSTIQEIQSSFRKMPDLTLMPGTVTFPAPVSKASKNMNR